MPSRNVISALDLASSGVVIFKKNSQPKMFCRCACVIKMKRYFIFSLLKCLDLDRRYRKYVYVNISATVNH